MESHAKRLPNKRRSFPTALLVAAAFGGAVVPLQTAATTDKFDTRIVGYRVSADSENQGGCTAFLQDAPEYAGESVLSCGAPDNRVTFDCTGNFMSKTEARRNLEAAKEAFYFKRDVTVKLDDDYGTTEHDMYGRQCLVMSIEVHPEPEPETETETETETAEG